MPEAEEYIAPEVVEAEVYPEAEAMLPRCNRLKILKDFWISTSWMTWIWFSA